MESKKERAERLERTREDRKRFKEESKYDASTDGLTEKINKMNENDRRIADWEDYETNNN